jgi:hypothetical protein
MRPLTELKDILDSQGRSQAWLNRKMDRQTDLKAGAILT